MISRRISYNIALTLAFAALVSACSVEKNTGSSRFYNSLVSRYNIYFNGIEAYKAGVAKVKSSHRDDYSSILPVFEYSTPESAQVCNSDMERAIQKASKVIALHSITAKPEQKKGKKNDAGDEEFQNRREYNEWVDDAYLLMAKAQFYQKNYIGARATLSYNMGITIDPDIKNESTIWMARILTEEGNYSQAERIMQDLGATADLSRSMMAMINTTNADIALRQKRYVAAIDPLEKAIDYSSDKHSRVRLTYLLAQVCKAEGNYALSTRYFQKVIRMNPPYDLEFNAGINLAGVTDISSGDVEDLKKTLRRMMRDARNKDYLDQIYFALAELEQRQGNSEEAIRLYALSVSSSTINSRQKARSYLAMGEHFFSLPRYDLAGSYYDSAVYLIDRRFPDYDFISRRSSDLNAYTAFHSIVTAEDSLRRVAMMSDAERDALISQMIRKYEQEVAEAKQTGSEERYNMGQYYENEERYRYAIATEGNWYFYNQSALTFGRTEFRRRWGERKLEDNWRRANRARAMAPIASGETPDDINETDSAATAPERTKEFYLRNLPLTDSLMNSSLSKSADALLGEGKILASRLNDTLSAATSLEAAARPGGSDITRAEALYELYRIHRPGNPAAAEGARETLISLFPSTEYAMILSDPDYVKKQMERAQESKILYEKAYAAFKENRYQETSSLCREAVAKYPNDDLAPKFMLLGAMAAGASEGEMAYKEALDSLVAKYPSTEEGERAAEIITVLRREIPEIRIAEDKRIVETLYVADTSQTHYVMVIAENIRANLNQMVFDVINYNLDKFPDSNFRTEGALVDTDFLMITIGSFRNADQAKSYYKIFNPLKEIRGADEARISMFVISEENLGKFRSDKSIVRYSMFHENTYPDLK